MRANTQTFSSKILLFGEYLILFGSKALTMPLRKYSGTLKFDTSVSPEKKLSGEHLKQFYQYLYDHRENFPNDLKINLEGFKNDILKGLYLDSNVPQAYGVGSSGVLVAAVYGRYAEHTSEISVEADLTVLKKHFSFLESFFHGTSSGIDPLSCFTGKPLLVISGDRVNPAELPKQPVNKPVHIFLVDTKHKSATSGLVSDFIKKLRSSDFKKNLTEKGIPLNNRCIDLFLTGDSLSFNEEVNKLSEFQYKYFYDLIPGSFISLWEKSLSESDFALKICGSGAGGFILGYTSEIERIIHFFDSHQQKLILV